MLFNSSQTKIEPIGIEPDGSISTNKQLQKKIKTNQKLAEVFSDLEKEKDIHFVSGGIWSTHDLVKFLLKKTGKAELTACTWSITNPALEKLKKMISSGYIEKLNMLLDWSKGKEAAVWIRANADKFNTSTCHAKVTVIQNKKWNIAIVGSANWTNNPRIEAGVLTTNRETVEFHKKWIMDEINRENTLGL